MGVVIRQGIKQSIVSYVGVLIGTLNVLVLYPWVFTTEQLGLFRFVIDTSLLSSPFVLLGLNQVNLKYFPMFKNEENGHNGFLGFLILGVLGGVLLFGLLVLLFGSTILDFYSDKSPLFISYIPYMVPLICLMVYMRLFLSYCINFKRIVIPTIFENLFIKIATSFLLLAFGLKWIGFGHVVQGAVVCYFFVVLAFIWYIRRLGQWYVKTNWSFFNRPLLKGMGIFASYGVLGGMSSIIATRVDIVMVASLSNGHLNDAGIYSIALFLIGIIDIPTKAIIKIINPIISQAWKDNNTSEIQNLYTRSSINLFIVGLFLLLGIWASIDEFYQLIPNGEQYVPGKYVVLILGVAKLFDMVTSINTPIISFSKFFRFNFYAILSLAVFNVLTNFLFIPIYQINGAALATMASMLLYNILKLGFIQSKMKMHPFSWNTLWVLLLGILAYGATFLVPGGLHPFVGLLLKSIVITLIFGGGVLAFKLSPDINGLLKQVLKKLGIGGR